MTSGSLPDLGEGLGLPDEIIRRHQEEMETRVRQRAQPPVRDPQAPQQDSEEPTVRRDLQGAHAARSQEPVGEPAPADGDQEAATRPVALTLAVLVLAAALAIVGFLAVRFRDFGTGRDKAASPSIAAPASSTTPTPTPKATPTPKPAVKPKPTPKPSPTMTLPPEASRKCSETVQTNEQTSCGTALAMERLSKGKSGTFQIRVTSPTSGRTFSSTCEKGNPYTVCTAGVAKAWIKS